MYKRGTGVLFMVPFYELLYYKINVDIYTCDIHIAT